jgi:hypothetical protein
MCPRRRRIRGLPYQQLVGVRCVFVLDIDVLRD